MATPLPNPCSALLAAHLRPGLFRALCDANRLALLAQIAVAPAGLTVTEASRCCGVHLSGVSRHLSLLRAAGVVTAHKSGREVTYRLAGTELVAALRGLADALETCCTTSDCCSPPPAGGPPGAGDSQGDPHGSARDPQAS